MGRHYTQLDIEDRCELARLHAQGHSLRHIAATLDRAPATIARELKRNRSRQQGYRPRYAQEQARARRWGGARLDRDAALRSQVLARLKQGWSPEQIAGRFRRERGRTIIAHETIYRFIYAQATRTEAGRAWRHYLPRAKWKRGWRGRRGGSPATFIHLRRSLAARPTTASDRQTDLATLTDTRFTELVQLYNNTPRKCLDYRTPAEVFWNDVLHFQCESTFPLAPQ